MTNPLLLTKFHIPPVRSSLVQRDRLLERLNRSLSGKLSLISAPAGSGKTTLLSEWLRQTNLPSSWLSLDEGDNDPLRFWTYFVAALQQSHPNIGATTLSMLRSLESPSFESFLIPLINEITSFSDERILVLDDYQAISARPIHEAMTFLLGRLPPQLHLAIASRVDPPLPLARWRVRNQLMQLGAADLCFTLAETTAFINQSMQLSLSQDQVATLQARTEGWIAGLQLAALSMRDVKDISTFIASLTGDRHYILDYLVEEVLERQPKPLQSFLLRTSILERMCGDLCQAVVEGARSLDGTETLAQLEHRNLFVVPLDDNRQWYRYHHLFRQLLLDRLQRTEPEQVSEYHRRAREWYEHHGFVTEAISHAIAAGDFPQAADSIEREAQLTNPRVEPARLLTFLKAMPDGLVWTRPWLLLSYAWALYSTARFPAAVQAVQSLESLLQQQKPSANTEKLWGLVTAIKGIQARQQGATAESVTLMKRALQQLPQDDSWLRAVILLNLGVTYFVTDNYAAARRLLPEVTQIGQNRGIADPAIAPLYLQAQFLALRGWLDEATVLCQQGVGLARERGWLSTYAGVLVQVAMGELLREQNQLVAAVQHLTESIERGIQTRQPGLMMGYITLARVRQAQGDTQAAMDAIKAAGQCQVWLWATILSVPACQARLNLAQGNLDAAIIWAEDSGLSVDGKLRYSFTDEFLAGSELDYLTLARVLITRGKLADPTKPYLDDALRLLERLHDFTAAGGRKARVMEVLMLQALVWHNRGDRKRSLHLLQQALDLPHTGDYIRLFVDEGQPMAELLRQAVAEGIHPQSVNRLLAAFSQVEGTAAKVQPLIEPLSDRELEVLQHLAQGLSNRAIADKLFVTLAAIKWHARNIYGKLDVSNRTQAVAKARELGILV
ncbi:LuxR family transcriptional regulator [Chroococcidiopsis sp. FACHB-1243]|uniref:LuxR C-terminal-related transcriptional regulator n=1 Tax=Chroococcidiopsis sp. [FACHB-1243] TaxID=2692781 RepID=UPI00177DC3AD|nr:LuxR C-terminal-related transcriptional regulator [Chroococcidiopsis sp. [FACHB-1243]]MBD2307241.1 LuxR family transcriptional regulator [Chroococcidiopsis sp. [FACHB-1243]]